MKEHNNKEIIKYYLISYAHEQGFGNMFFEVSGGDLNIRDAENEIKTKNKYKQKPIIITINEISEEQYVPKKYK